MKGQATKLQAAEVELKQLMADVSRAVQKAQDAIARITCKPATDAVAAEAAAASSGSCRLLHLSPLAGRGRRAFARRVRGPARTYELAARAPHPDPLPASGRKRGEGAGRASGTAIRQFEREARLARLTASGSPAGSGTPPLRRPTPRPTSGRARRLRRSCRASSTTCRSGSADSPRASPPTPPGGPAA
jgi:hypothetical protein